MRVFTAFYVLFGCGFVFPQFVSLFESLQTYLYEHTLKPRFQRIHLFFQHTLKPLFESLPLPLFMRLLSLLLPLFQDFLLPLFQSLLVLLFQRFLYEYTLKPCFQRIQNFLFQRILMPRFQRFLLPLYKCILKPLYEYILKPLYEHILEPPYEHILKPLFQSLYRRIHTVETVAPTGERVYIADPPPELEYWMKELGPELLRILQWAWVRKAKAVRNRPPSANPALAWGAQIEESAPLPFSRMLPAMQPLKPSTWRVRHAGFFRSRVP